MERILNSHVTREDLEDISSGIDGDLPIYVLVENARRDGIIIGTYVSVRDEAVYVLTGSVSEFEVYAERLAAKREGQLYEIYCGDCGGHTPCDELGDEYVTNKSDRVEIDCPQCGSQIVHPKTVRLRR